MKFAKSRVYSINLSANTIKYSLSKFWSKEQQQVQDDVIRNLSDHWNSWNGCATQIPNKKIQVYQ